MIASASGNGKTALGRELARRLDVPFVELDALVHGSGWVETPVGELRAKVEPIVASDEWVIDGGYQHLLGDLVLRGADVIVWGWTCRSASGFRVSSAARRDASVGESSSGTATASRCSRRSGAASRCSAGRFRRTFAAGASGRGRSLAIRSSGSDPTPAEVEAFMAAASATRPPSDPPGTVATRRESP